jgi:ATP-binding cassette subfamily B protein
MVSSILQLYTPRVLKKAVDNLQPENLTNLTPLLHSCWLIILIALGYGIFSFAARMLIIRSSRFIEYAIRNEFLLRLQQHSPAYFQKFRTGDFMTRATSDLNAIRMLLGPGIMQPANLIIMLGAGLGFMLTLDARLTLFLLIPVPPAIFIAYWTLHLIQKTYQSVQTLFSAITTRVQENIAGIRVIKSYVQEEFEIAEFAKQNEEYIQRNITLAKIRSFLWSSMSALLGLSTVILLWFGGQNVVQGKISLGDFVAFTAYIGMLAWPVFSIGWVLNIYKRAVTSMERLNEILRSTPEIADGPRTDFSITKIFGKIEFEDVTFSYRTDVPPTLKNLNFRIEPGQTVAFVGPTGSGKSSIMHLINRLYEAQTGVVRLDGRDIREIPLKVLRQNMGSVSQEPFLFSSTIRENIGFGKDSVTPTEVENAADWAQISEEIKEFPEQFETPLGERGINLSGGQKQRVAIARALLRKSPILMLDDALSSVDTHTEEKILGHLREILHQRTSLIVSHRISAIKNANPIFVLDQGKIVEQGSHPQLIASNGIYAKLYKKQLLQESLSEME